MALAFVDKFCSMFKNSVKHEVVIIDRPQPFCGFPRLVVDRPPIMVEEYDDEESPEEREYRLAFTRLFRS